jgi:rhodanese-related sulfurtransferase
MPITKGVDALVAEASAEITTYTAEQAIEMATDPNVLLVDIRDVRELQRDGQVPGALHAPRGMLEFWVDPNSRYYKEVFGEPKTFVLFCAGGGRSALAALALQQMGMDTVAHIGSGFRGWRDAGGTVEQRPRR